MKARLPGISLVIAAAMGLSACASPVPSGSPIGTPDGPTIVAVYGDFQWYPPCTTWPIEIGEDLYFPLPIGTPPVDESLYPVPTSPAGDNLRDEGSLALGVELGLPRVMPPGPGDDIGWVTIYSDGMARFESDSGKVAWLTGEEQTYDYVC